MFKPYNYLITNSMDSPISQRGSEQSPTIHNCWSEQSHKEVQSNIINITSIHNWLYEIYFIYSMNIRNIIFPIIKYKKYPYFLYSNKRNIHISYIHWL